MRTTKNFFGLILALIPIVYIGGLLLYFNGIRSWAGGWLDGILGPTMFGLGAIGLLFVFLFVLRLRRAATPPPGTGARPNTALEEEKSDFDPDAAIARYMARRAAGGLGHASPASFEGGPPVRPGSFGRKGA